MRVRNIHVRSPLLHPSTLAARREPATRDLYPPVVLIADHAPDEEEAAALAELVRTEVDKWVPIIKKAGVTAN